MHPEIYDPMDCFFCGKEKAEKGFFDSNGEWACDDCGSAEFATQAIERAQEKANSDG